MRVSEIDTPAVIVDLDVMERNLRRVADYAREHGLNLRPHTKTHKSPELGKRQLELGAVGLTVAKVSEAEVLVKAGPPELLVAYPLIGRRKLDRLTSLARERRMMVALDNLEAARQLSDAAREARVEVGVLVEVDAGLNRVGVSPGDAVDLARSVSRLPHVRYEGVTMYPGHVKALDEDGLRAIDAVGAMVDGLVAELKGAGLGPRVVSGGSTPALFHSHRVKGWTEIRPGTYIFNDRNTVACGACGWEDCAATVLCTVVSTARPGQMIIDGGSKTFSSDRLATGGEPSFGKILEAPGAHFHKMNEEHGYVDMRRAERRFDVGDKVRVLMNHVCVVINLHEQVYGVRGGEVEEVWKVEARGKLQ